MEIRTVKVRGTVLGSGRTKICVPLTGRGLKELEEQIARLGGAPFDMLEWRADYFAPLCDDDAALRALQMVRAAAGEERGVLFTFRTKAEGGERALDAAEYEAMIRRITEIACPAGQDGQEGCGLIDLVDLELSLGAEALLRLGAFLHGRGIRTVMSEHHFDGTPTVEEMTGALRRMQELGADITKLAVMPKDRSDVARLLTAACLMADRYADRPCVTMSMGKLGVLSRVSGCLTGCAFTFGTAGRASAPGQLPAESLEEILGILEMQGE